MDLSIKAELDALYKKYNQKSFINDDPIQFVHKYASSKKDQEVVGFIISTLAFGQRKKMIPFIDKVLSHIHPEPYKCLFHFSVKDINFLESLVYRFIKGVDIHLLFYRVHKVLKKYTTLENLFEEGFNKYKLIKPTITHFVETIYNIKTPDILCDKVINRDRSFKFLLPSPKAGSACKRFNLFLRWMIRKDSVDLGLWKNIPQSDLLIPLDTHVARVSKSLSLTERKTLDWRMAEEITLNLKKLDSEDPVKYDFALFGYGVNNQKRIYT